MKQTVLLCLLIIGSLSMKAQTKEALETQKAAKQAEASVIQQEINALQTQIDALPGWKTGAFGIIGGNVSNFNNWFAQGIPNNSSGTIGITFNGFANLRKDTFFWRNALTANLNWIKLDDKDLDTDDDNFSPTTDIFNLTSLYGINLTEKFAVSGLLEYRTTLLNNFNDPGYLDLGIGGTWTPLENLIIVIHPLNYNFIFSSSDMVFESSLGTKIIADYSKQIGAINLKTNVSIFQSYDSRNYSNWTWTTAFNYTLWKMIGIGFDFGLRSNEQEALNHALKETPATATSFEDLDNKLQTYYTIGLSYKF